MFVWCFFQIFLDGVGAAAAACSVVCFTEIPSFVPIGLAIASFELSFELSYGLVATHLTSDDDVTSDALEGIAEEGTRAFYPLASFSYLVIPVSIYLSSPKLSAT